MEKWASPSFCHWDQSKNDVLLLIIGVGKNWAGPFFPHLEKWKHQPCADGYLGEEKLGRPILSPPRLVKTSTIPCHEYANNLCFLRGGEKLGRPILSPPQQDKTSTLWRWLSGWRKFGWSISFPPWQVKASNLPCHEYTYNLCLLGDGEKLGRPSLSPPWLMKVLILCRR